MEKTEMMKKFEAKMGMSSVVRICTGIDSVDVMSNEYICWAESYFSECEAKAAAYDRIMGGGKKTLKEWANIFGMVIAVDQNGEASCFAHVPVPVMYLNADDGIWTNSPENYGEETYLLPPDLIDFNGDWKDSLTLPDGWVES